MKKKWQNASYTIEAAIYIPIILYVLFQSIEIGIDFWQESKDREISKRLLELDVVQEFYAYQIIDEVKEVKEDD